MSEVQNTQTQFDWECNFCGQQEGVENGVCPKCGPSQTTPLSDAAKEEAGVITPNREENSEATNTQETNENPKDDQQQQP